MRLEEACRLVATHFAGRAGIFAYEAFDYINARFFSDQLPQPLIVWALTPHGREAGFVSYNDYANAPMVVLHFSVLRGRETSTPWGVPAEFLGWCFAYDVLLNLCLHLSVHYRLGGYNSKVAGASSVNNPQFASEVNRLAPLLGFVGIEAGCYRMKRVPTGKRQRRELKDGRIVETEEKKPAWVPEGNIPARLLGGFPATIRMSAETLGIPHVRLSPGASATEFYGQDEVPFHPGVSATAYYEGIL